MWKNRTRVHEESKEEEYLARWFSGPEAEYASQEEYTAWLRENWGPWNDVRALGNYEKVTCPVLFLPAEAEGDLTGKLATIESVKPAAEAQQDGGDSGEHACDDV